MALYFSDRGHCQREGCRKRIAQSNGSGRIKLYCSNACRVAAYRAAPALKTQRDVQAMTDHMTRRAMGEWGARLTRPTVAGLVTMNRAHGYASAQAAFELIKLALEEDARQRDLLEFRCENPNWDYGDETPA